MIVSSVKSAKIKGEECQRNLVISEKDRSTSVERLQPAVLSECVIADPISNVVLVSNEEMELRANVYRQRAN